MQFKFLCEIQPSHFPSPVYPLNQCEEEEAYESLEMCFSLSKKLDLGGLKSVFTFSTVLYSGPTLDSMMFFKLQQFSNALKPE